MIVKCCVQIAKDITKKARTHIFNEGTKGMENHEVDKQMYDGTRSYNSETCVLALIHESPQMYIPWFLTSTAVALGYAAIYKPHCTSIMIKYSVRIFRSDYKSLLKK